MQVGFKGIMEDTNRGSFEVISKSIGLNISFPNGKIPNSIITLGLFFKFNFFAQILDF